MDPTANLPDETLAYLFMHVQVADPCARRARENGYIVRRDIPQPSRAALLGWIKITFVNRRWRQVAVESAMLWTRLNGELGMAWVDEFLRRSKNAYLHIDDEDFVMARIPMHQLLPTCHTR